MASIAQMNNRPNIDLSFLIKILQLGLDNMAKKSCLCIFWLNGFLSGPLWTVEYDLAYDN